MKEMKKLLFLAAAVIMVAALTVPISAGEYEYVYESMEETAYPDAEMKALLDSVPDEAREEAEAVIEAAAGDDGAKAVTEKLSFKYLIGSFLSYIGDLLLPTAADCAGLLALIISSSLLTAFFRLKENSTLKSACELAVNLTISAAVAKVALGVVSTVSTYITYLCAMMNAMLPVMGAVHLSSGTVSQMAVNSSAMMLYITVTENLCREFFVPAAGALLALTVASGAFKHINIGGLAAAVKKWVITVLAFAVTVFSFILGIQTSLAKSADTLAAKTVKFAVGSSVPIVGGAVSDALTTVSASLSMIKKVTGGTGIALILIILIPVLASLLMNKLMMLVCKCSADILGCESASAAVADADAVLSIFTAVAVMSAVLFVFAVTLFMNSGISA